MTSYSIVLKPEGSDDMIKRIDPRTLEDSGVFYEWAGRVTPW